MPSSPAMAADNLSRASPGAAPRMNAAAGRGVPVSSSLHSTLTVQLKPSCAALSRIYAAAFSSMTAFSCSCLSCSRPLSILLHLLKIALQPALSRPWVEQRQGAQHRRQQYQSAGELSHPLYRPLGHQGLSQGRQDGRRRHPQHPVTQGAHGTAAATAAIRLTSSSRAQAPVMPRIRPKAEPMSSISLHDLISHTIPARAAASL